MIACSEERQKVQTAKRRLEDGQPLHPLEAARLLDGMARVYQRLEGHTFIVCEYMHVLPVYREPVGWLRRLWRWAW